MAEEVKVEKVEFPPVESEEKKKRKEKRSLVIKRPALWAISIGAAFTALGVVLGKTTRTNEKLRAENKTLRSENENLGKQVNSLWYYLGKNQAAKEHYKSNVAH